MEKAKSESFYIIFANSRPTVAMTFLVTIICALGYIARTSSASDTRRTTLLSTAVIKTDATSEDGNPGQWQTVQMRVTAYCPCPKCCGSYSDGVTASGHKISPGDSFAAADSRYPFGTEIIIAGYNSGQAVEVLDRGGAITGNRLDVFFHSHQEALNWGVRYLDVKIRSQQYSRN